MGKKYDSKEVLEFIEQLEEAVGQYRQRAEALDDAYVNYVENDTHVGLAAEASKKFISDKQTGFHLDQIEIQRKLLRLYYEIHDLFKETVDPSSIARIDTDVIEEIKEIFQKYQIPFDIKSTEIENKAKALQDKFSKYGSFTQPSFHKARLVCNELCGDGEYLDKVVKDIEDFDQESCEYVDRADIDQILDDYITDVTRAAAVLDEAKAYNPQMKDVFVDVVSMGASEGIKHLTTEQLNEKVLIEFYDKLRTSPYYTEAIMGRYKTAEQIIKMSAPFSQDYIDIWLLNEDNKLAYLTIKQMLNPGTDQGVESFWESINNRKTAIKWLDPNYTMSDAEVNRAKEIANTELAKIESSESTLKYEFIYGKRHYVKYDELLRELTEKETIEYANYEVYRLLKDKTSQPMSFANGIMGYGAPIRKAIEEADAELTGTLREMTGAQTLSDTYQGIEDVDKKYARIALDKQNAMAQNPRAVTAANAIIDTGLYIFSSGMLQTYGLTEAMSATRAFAANQYIQFAQDAFIRYIPQYFEYASDGKVTKAEGTALASEMLIGTTANVALGELDTAVKMSATSPIVASLDTVNTKYDITGATDFINTNDELANGTLHGAASDKPEQLHHFATNKNQTYTPQFEEIANKYGLDLDDKWNKEYMPHQGRHPNEYHDYVLENMKQFDYIAQGDKDVFLKLYENMKKHISDNPDMLYKEYWRNGGH